jgi:hypothetical protein
MGPSISPQLILPSLLRASTLFPLNRSHPPRPNITMASGLFVGPHKLLIIAPVVTSASTFWFAVDQSIMLSIFLDPAHRTTSNAVLPHFFDKLLPRALAILFSLNGLSAAISITNIMRQSRLLRQTDATKWYWSGLFFSIAHFAFAPAVAHKIRDMVENRTSDNTAVLKKWMTVHRIRMFTVDLLSLVCFVVGACSAVNL